MIAGSQAGFSLVANVSLLFAELPLLERFAAAADAGFAAVELWWPFDGPTPDDREVDALVDAIAASGIPLFGMNLWAGDMPSGERGVLSQPKRSRDFRASVAVTARITQRTGCRVYNALYGQRVIGETAQAQDSTALDNLAYAVSVLRPLGGTLMIEPLSVGLNGDYPIVTVDDALRVVRQVRDRTESDGIALLFDTFHLANNGHELGETVATAEGFIGHVQLADSPGRGEPGTGTIDTRGVLDTLWESGYRGAVAAEYVPSVPTLDSFGWIDRMPHLSLIARPGFGGG